MANKILLLGEPGTGKTTSASTLDPKTTFFIVPDNKELPFKGWKKNYKTVYKPDGKIDLKNTNFIKTTDPNKVITLLKIISSDLPHIKVIILDTLTSLMIDEYMRKLKDVGYSKFNDLALDTYNILKTLDTLRDDLCIVINAHVENNYDSDGVLRTSFKVPGGKLIGQNIKVEGMFTLVLYTEVNVQNGVPSYHFITQNNGKNTCKSPMGMFEDTKIPNDLQYVLDKIKEYEN